MTIYFLQNKVNDRIYVGQTINPVERRWYSHRYYLKRGDHTNDYLQNSWNKHGEEAFEFGVLENGIKSLEELNEAEKFWVQVLQSRTFQWGYNIEPGGGSCKPSKATLRKVTAANGGKPVVHIPTEVEYYSQREAARQTGVHRKTVYEHCYNNVENPEYKFIEDEKDTN